MNKLKTYIQIDPATSEVINIIQTDNTDIHESYISIADSDIEDKKEGFTLVFDKKTSTVKNVADKRGSKIYNKKTQEEQEQVGLGAISENFTLLAPASEFYEWNEKAAKWAKNEAKEKTAKIEKIQAALMSLCDSKQESAKKLILGYKATAGQEQRYLHKYNQAKQFLANLNLPKNQQTPIIFTEITNLEKAEAIISNYEQAESAVLSFANLIEIFREKVADLIEAGELDKANHLILAGQNFNEATKIADIQKLLSNEK